MQMTKLSFLVIGAGAIGRRHASNLLELGYMCKVIAFRDLLDLKSILRQGSFDGVIVATASQVRSEVLSPCFDLKIPVYIEKPIAYDQKTLDHIFSLPEDYLKKCYAGFMMRCHPMVLFLQELDYSDAYNFSFEIGHDVTQWRQNWKFSDSYAADPDGGGVLLDLCHEIDLANILFAPLTVQEVMSLDHQDFTKVDFASTITFSNKLNLIGTVSMDYLSPVSRRRLTIKSTQYVDEIDFLTGEYRRVTRENTTVKNLAFERNNMFLDVLSLFCKSIMGEESSLLLQPSLDKVKTSCELIVDSWENRKFVGSVKGDF